VISWDAPFLFIDTFSRYSIRASLKTICLKFCTFSFFKVTSSSLAQAFASLAVSKVFDLGGWGFILTVAVTLPFRF